MRVARQPAGLGAPRYSQSLERGLAILSCFSSERPVRGIAEIADELGMSRSTTHRYVVTLLALNYLEQGAGRKYRLGVRVADLGMSALASTELREQAGPYLRQLRQQTSHTVALSVLDATELLYLDRVPSPRRGARGAGRALAAGSRVPAHCTAAGKLLLAAASQQEQRRAIASIGVTGLGPNAITAKSRLRRTLADLRDAGVVLSDEELSPERYEIAAPIRYEGGCVFAALSLEAEGPGAISPQHMLAALSPQLLSTALAISARLGCRSRDGRR